MITMLKFRLIQLMSYDEDVMPDALAGLAASAALALSDIL
jgi:polyribonucleotide nucleotidyltransferase